MPPSTLSLLGLVRHMTEVERSWFRRRLDRQDVPWVHCTPDGHADLLRERIDDVTGE